MRYLPLFLALAAAPLACDTDADLEQSCSELEEPSRSAPYVTLAAPASAPVIDFRNDTSWMKVIQKPVQLAMFIKLAQACDITQGVTITLSGWLPDLTKKDAHVVGFGFSMMATQALKDCMVTNVAAAGGVDYK